MAETIQVTLKTIADISDVTSNVQQIQQLLNRLNLPDTLRKRFTELFDNVERNATNASNALTRGFKDRHNLIAYNRALDNINSAVGQIAANLSSIDVSKLHIRGEEAEYQKVNKEIEQFRNTINSINASELSKVQEFFKKSPTNAKAWEGFKNAFETGDLEKAETHLKRLKTQLNRFINANPDQSKWSSLWTTYAEGVQIYDHALKTAKGETDEVVNAMTGLHNAEQKIADIDNQALQRFMELLMQAGHAANQTAAETNNFSVGAKQAAASTAEMNRELDQVKSRITHFFGIANAVNLFKRAVRSAFETVKDLDAVMTEAAVVTQFDVSDMWEQLPEYTKRASELGVTIHDVYEASTLYYQQGVVEI